ncbi:MAG: amino acid adenylation domain-containing protein [Myxococcota bacterium]
MTTGLLHHWPTVQAERRPGALAIVTDDRRVTYGELEAQSNRIARALVDGGCRPGDRVALLLPKAPDTIAAMVGVLKAGCAYVPTDPDSPVARTARILRRSEPRVILCGDSGRSLLEGLVADGILDERPAVAWMGTAEPPFPVRFGPDDLATLSSETLAIPRKPEDPAHILFTSGSTGEPKGVVVTHGSASAFIEWANRHFGVSDRDRVSGHSPLHFDLSTYDVYGAFAAGAELHPVPPTLNLLPHRLAAFIRDRALTRWFSVPSLLTWMARVDAVGRDDFPELRHLLWCGEVFPTSALKHWMERLPHVTFTNLYGPTEAAIASTWYTVPGPPADEAEEIPIGRPCDGEDVRIVDEDLAALPMGEIGEICIEGVGLSPGYWRDPERTAAAFAEAPDGARVYRTGDLGHRDEDGVLWFHGRKDSQIKSRGYRIELGEIENALHGLDALAECAVVAVDAGGFEGMAIAAAYSPKNGGVSPSTIRQALLERIPRYMLPTRWMEMERLPRNANGKIDRRTLTERFRDREASPAG